MNSPDTNTEEAPLGVETMKGEGEAPQKDGEEVKRLTRVITLNPSPGKAEDVLAGMTQFIADLKAEMDTRPGMHVRFELGEPEDGADDTSNDLAKALDEQKDTQVAGTARVNDFAQAVQTAMRKNGIANCGWVVVVPPAKDAKEGTAEAAPRFFTGGTDRTHNWLKESLELAASVRTMMASRQASGMEGMKQLQSGLVVPDDQKVVAPERPPLVLVPG